MNTDHAIRVRQIMDCDFRAGDIVLTSSQRWLARLIRFGTRRRGESRTVVNHAGCIVDDGGTLVEALKWVEHHNIAQHYGGCKDRVAIFRPANIPEEDLEKIASEMWRHIGQSYGYAKIGLHVIDGLLGKLGIRPIASRLAVLDRYPICSHLVAIAYAEAGYNFNVRPQAATPDDIWDFVTADDSPYECVRELASVPRWPYRFE